MIAQVAAATGIGFGDLLAHPLHTEALIQVLAEQKHSGGVPDVSGLAARMRGGL